MILNVGNEAMRQLTRFGCTECLDMFGQTHMIPHDSFLGSYCLTLGIQY